MARIGIIHTNLMTKGGGENVCMHTIEALQDDHDLVLLTDLAPNFDELNQYYGTDVRSIPVREVSTIAGLISRISSIRFGVMRNAFLNRSVRKIENQFDLLVSTQNEYGLEQPSLQYIHYPFLDRAVGPDKFKPNSSAYAVYDIICSIISGFDEQEFDKHKFLVNSHWTGKVLQTAYGVSPEVVYPPVQNNEFDGQQWNDRESGFICLGRIDPSKNTLDLIDIVEEINERGNDFHIHIVGPIASSRYHERVKNRAKNSSAVKLEGEVSRERLIRLLETHKYGIHGRENEHFGIAIAEMVAAGMIPFVPANGGQVEIVDEIPELLYSSSDEAVSKITFVTESSTLQSEIHQALPDVEEKFGPGRFRQEIQNAVDSMLS